MVRGEEINRFTSVPSIGGEERAILTGGEGWGEVCTVRGGGERL